jgi:hypothetical protein
LLALLALLRLLSGAARGCRHSSTTQHVPTRTALPRRSGSAASLTPSESNAHSRPTHKRRRPRRASHARRCRQPWASRTLTTWRSNTKAVRILRRAWWQRVTRSHRLDLRRLQPRPRPRNWRARRSSASLARARRETARSRRPADASSARSEHTRHWQRQRRARPRQLFAVAGCQYGVQQLERARASLGGNHEQRRSQSCRAQLRACSDIATAFNATGARAQVLRCGRRASGVARGSVPRL